MILTITIVRNGLYTISISANKPSFDVSIERNVSGFDLTIFSGHFSNGMSALFPVINKRTFIVICRRFAFIIVRDDVYLFPLDIRDHLFLFSTRIARKTRSCLAYDASLEHTSSISITVARNKITCTPFETLLVVFRKERFHTIARDDVTFLRDNVSVKQSNVSGAFVFCGFKDVRFGVLIVYITGEGKRQQFVVNIDFVDLWMFI